MAEMEGVRLKTITYDLSFGDAIPKPEDFLCSIVNGGIGSIYHVVTVQKVNSKYYRFRYKLGVLTANDMKPFAKLIDREVWVHGQRAFPIYWYSRNRKPQPTEDKK